MKRISQLPLVPSGSSIRSSSKIRSRSIFAQRCLHSSTSNPATVYPIVAAGPPPKAPTPSAEHVDSRVARRRKQAELLKKGQDLRDVAAGTGGGSAKTKRFWKDVHVKHVAGIYPDHSQIMSKIFEIHDSDSVFLQKVYKSISTPVLSVAQRKKSSQSPTTNHTSHPPLLSNGIS